MKPFDGQKTISIDIDLFDDMLRALNTMKMTRVEGLKSLVRLPDDRMRTARDSYELAAILGRVKREFDIQTGGSNDV